MQVLSEFEGDKSAERFMDEYKKIYEALKDAHKQQRHYMLRCSYLQSDIKNNAEKVNLALHLSREDREIINNLSQVKINIFLKILKISNYFYVYNYRGTGKENRIWSRFNNDIDFCKKFMHEISIFIVSSPSPSHFDCKEN